MKIPVSKAYARWMDEDAERLNAMAELARKVAVTLPSKEDAEKRAFCPTGPGGGVDNSCSSVSVNDPSLKERVPFKPADGKNSDFIRVPTLDELTEALTGSNSAKGTKIGSAKDLPAGTPVALRIDIPAFNYSTTKMGKAIYAVTVHEDKGGKSFGSPIGYEPMARLTGDVKFAAKEGSAIKVATGESAKFPLATVKGKFDPSRTMPPDIDSWTPVGYDPKKASYFYDKKTGREVMGGTDAVSVGNSVFVRIPKYGYRNAKETYRDAGFWGIEYRAADCVRDEDGKFGSGNKCAGDGSTTTTGKPPVSTPTSTKMPTAKVGDPANGTAWLSPSGQFHPVPRVKPPALRLKSPIGFTTHDEWASLHGHEDGEDGLLKAGWARVAKMGGESFVQTVGSPLTSKQKKSLEDQAIIAGYDSIVHDMAPSMDDRGGPGTKHKTIWSKSDRSWKEDGEARAFCPTGEGGGVDNSCSASDSDSGSSGSPTATASPAADKPPSSLFSTNENKSWFPAYGDEPFPGASRYADIKVSGGKAVANSLDSMGIKPEDAISLTGAPDRSSVFMRPAPEFGQKFYAFSGTNTPPVFMGFEADVAGVRGGLEGTYVLGSRKNNETGRQDLVLYGNVIDVLPPVSATAERRHAAARAFYKTMVSGVENARKAGVSTVMFSAAGNSTDSDRPGSFRGYTIWPRMGFDGPLPKHVVAKLPPDLSHARTLMDLHATREGTKWWAKNGEDIDVELNLADRNSPQNKIFDRFVKHFSRDRRDLPLGEGDGWLSPEDLARLDEMWAEIWDEDGTLDDYDGGEQKFLIGEKDQQQEGRAYCPTGEGNGVDNSCSSSGASGGMTNFGGKSEPWGKSNETEIWTPGKPLFKGADGIGEIMINRPADVRGIAEELGVTIGDVLSGSGVSVDAAKRLPISRPRVVVTTEGDKIQVSWRCTGAATGKGYKTEDEKEFAPRRGTIVEAVSGARAMFSLSGQSVLEQQAYGIHPDFQGNGIAMESVLRQVSAPFDTISMQAARFDHADPSQRLSGYSAWWKYGYNAPIDRVVATLQRRHGTGSREAEIPAKLLKGSRSLLDIMAKPGGPEWWKEFGGDITLTFDTRPGSQGRVRLLDLKAASDKKRNKRSEDVSDTDGRLPLSSDCEHDPIVEEVIKGTIGKPVKGRPMTDEEWAEENALVQEIEQRRAKDGRPPEVRPY